MADAQDLAILYKDFTDTYDWIVDNQLVSVSRIIAHSVFRKLEQASPLFLPFVNHYPRFFNRPSIPAPAQFDVQLHVEIMSKLLKDGGPEVQPVLLAFIAEIGLKLGLQVDTLSWVSDPGRRLHRQPPQPPQLPLPQPRLLDIVRNIPQIGDPKVGNQAPPGTWFACLLRDCQKSYLRQSSLEKHLKDDHKFSHTEVFEVFRDPANAGEQLQKRFGPFQPWELHGTGFDSTTLQLSRVPKRKRSQWQADDTGSDVQPQAQHGPV